MNSLICFPVSSYGVGQVSPVRVMAFWRILSFSSCVHLKMMWLIVCSSCSLQGQVEFGIILNLCRYDLFKPWPVTICVCVCVCVCVSGYIVRKTNKTFSCLSSVTCGIFHGICLYFYIPWLLVEPPNDILWNPAWETQMYRLNRLRTRHCID